MDNACRNCPALCESRTNVVHGYGDVAADFVFVEESPGRAADEAGVPIARVSAGNFDRSATGTDAVVDGTEHRESHKSGDGTGQTLRQILERIGLVAENCADENESGSPSPSRIRCDRESEPEFEAGEGDESESGSETETVDGSASDAGSGKGYESESASTAVRPSRTESSSAADPAAQSAGPPMHPTLDNAFLTALTRCRHPERPPTDDEIANCDPFLTAEIRSINPELIIPVGTRALTEIGREFTTARASTLDIESVHATTIRGRGFEILPMKEPMTASATAIDDWIDHFRSVTDGDYRQTKGRSSR